MGILALITTPIIIGVISSAKEQANRRSVDGLIRAGKNYLSESMIDASMAEKIKNQENLIDEISYEGKGPKIGQLYVNEHSDVALAVKYGSKCYKKEYTGNVETMDYNVTTCKLNINIKKPGINIIMDNVFNEHSWANKNFNVTINTIDYSELGTTIKWCGTNNEVCEPTTEVSTSSFIIPISQETSGSKICAKALDGLLNESEVVCSNVYKLDKTSPEFLGLTDIVMNQNDILDLESGVMLNDGLSGIENTFTYNPTDVDRTKAGEYTITYSGKDLAGNIGTGSRKVTVHTSVPSITFTPESGKVNANGWSKTNLYITINAIDYSSYGIEKIVWCGTTSNTCTPTSEVAKTSHIILLENENNNHHICAYAVDKFGQQSETICSEAYRIDKTVPIFNGLIDIEINQNDILDLESGVMLTDSLSGPESSFTYSPTDVDRSKAGEYTITYTGKDLAGNIETENRKVIVHTSAPSMTFTPEVDKINSNGWSKENMYITINAIDYSSYGIEKIVWCGTTGNSCIPTSEIAKNSHVILLENENNNHHICAYAVDKFGQLGETTCSEAYKIDKTNPSFIGIEDITINVGGIVNLTNGVSVTDALSGINGTFSYAPTMVDTSKTGSYPITYTVSDLAGNTKQITRNVIVTSGNPTINFTATEGSINGNGWAKSNFYVTVNSTDYSGHGIEKVVWCGTTSNTCTPSIEVNGTSQNVLISQESNNNRICAYAIDKGGHTGSVTCSDAYKLDKSIPTAGTFNVSGTIGSNGWYRSDVTLSANNGSDAISGHANTTISHTFLGTDTGGTVVTITTTDLAGNTSIRQATIYIDKTAPTTPTSMGFVRGDCSAYTEGTWSNQYLYATNCGNNISGSIDNESGVWKYQISADNMTWYDYNYNSGAYPYLLNSNGTHTRYYRAVDWAGNVSGSLVKTAHIDLSAPTTPTSMGFVRGDCSAYTEGTWSNQYLYATNCGNNISGSIDNESGVWKYQISADNMTWYDYNYNSGAYPYLLNSNGTHTRYYRAVDWAGNVSGSLVKTAYIDLSAPTIAINPTSINVMQGENYDLNTGVSIYDNGPSGIAWSSITVNGGAIYNTNILGVGTYTIVYTAADNAGNVVTATRIVTVNSPADSIVAMGKGDRGETSYAVVKNDGTLWVYSKDVNGYMIWTQMNDNVKSVAMGKGDRSETSYAVVKNDGTMWVYLKDVNYHMIWTQML